MTLLMRQLDLWLQRLFGVDLLVNLLAHRIGE
jgi:hypothetical protein